MKRQQGLSLVELMVAVLISSLMIIGVLEIFNRSFMADRDNTELTLMQESGRLALEIIGQNARMAGFQGCIPSDEQHTHKVYDGRNEYTISLPTEAVLSSNANTLIFHHAKSGSGCKDATGTQIPLKIEHPHVSRFEYTNSNGGISRNGQPLLENAVMEFTFLPTGFPHNSNSVQITITVSDSRSSGERLQPRSYSGTFEFRNRNL
jgi:type II secretory pathway component PulJ